MAKSKRGGSRAKEDLRGAHGARPRPREAPADRGGSGEPPGLDPARHAASQRAARQAEVMRETFFPALMATALGQENLFESKAYQVFLGRLVEDAGDPADPIERMILEQLALAHFRIGQLHVCASAAHEIEAVKIYNALAARLLGEFRRTALALRVFRSRAPEGKGEPEIKIHKLAQ